MLTTTRRGPGAPALLAIGLLFLLPAMAEAQLFPNRTIKRQRESCVAEPPFYKQVRSQYYGYFPTCWSKFPEGWACPCPNPELPNAAASYVKYPRQSLDAAPREPALGPDEEEGAMPGDQPAADPNLPPVPNTGSAFDELKPETPRQPLPPDPSTPPRDFNANPAPRPGDNPSVPPSNRVPPPTSLREMPSLPETSPTTGLVESRLEPGAMVMAPEATLTSNRPDLGPIPSTPATNPVAMADADQPQTGVPVATPAKAPKRRSLLGGLFGSSNRSVR